MSSGVNRKEMVKIGCSAGFWGDSATGAFQLVQQAEGMDYLVADYLAEVTMGILARMKKQGKARGGMGEGGFVSEFVHSIWKPLMKEILEKGIKVVVNAGGMNPEACKKAIEEVTAAAGLEVVVGAVTGDGLLRRAGELKQAGALKKFSVEEAGEPTLPDDKPCLSFNAYLGARPIALALAQGAQVVVTGRCADSAMVLGPLMYEFGWSPQDYDLLAAGSLAGHIIECGCQATGGNFTDWRESCFTPNGGWANVGFPLIECFPNGDFVVTKPENTGGLVTFGTVAEQLLYEIHNPAQYILPDVVLDFRSVTLTENYGGADRVLVSGTRGLAPTETYKISGTFLGGYLLSAQLLISGFDAREKAAGVAEAILRRSRQLLKAKGLDDFLATNVEFLGAEHTFGRNAASNSREIVTRISVHHSSPAGLKVFGRQVAPSATGMAPGITGGGGRPRPAPLIHHYSCLIAKSEVPVTVLVGEDFKDTATYCNVSRERAGRPIHLPSSRQLTISRARGVLVPLIALCYGRSGDKGDVANIGVICRKAEYYPLLNGFLTADVVHRFFAHFAKGKTTRYELPGVHALNFVMTKSLGGGGLGSLNIDKQGKSYAQILLTMMVPVPKEWNISVTPSHL